MNHLFANTQKTSLIAEYTKTIKSDRGTIIGEVESLPLVTDMTPANITICVMNNDHNDKKRYDDTQIMSFHSASGGDFVYTIQIMIKKILNKIFDNTNDLDLLISRCTFNYALYKGYRFEKFRNGKIYVRLSILEDVSESSGRKCFHTIRDYEIEITFEEVCVMDMKQSLETLKDTLRY